jgi:DNA-binding NarL/FixJ family response regulator
MATILVIDHHSVVRRGICCLLRDHLDGPTFIEADGAAGALRAIRAQSIDLTILEPYLPGTDGLRLIRELRERQRQTPMLAFSGLTQRELAHRTLRAGATGFLSKEAPLTELVASVTRFLTRSSAPQARGAHSLADPCPERAEIVHPAVHTPLSDRELQILRFLAQGKSAPVIGRLLLISPKTVNTHRGHIYQKLGVASTSELTSYAYQHGLVPCRRVSSQT